MTGAPTQGGFSSSLGQMAGNKLMNAVMPGGGRPAAPPMQPAPDAGPATKGKKMLGGLMHPNAAHPTPPLGAPQRPRMLGQPQQQAAPQEAQPAMQPTAALSPFTGNLDPFAAPDHRYVDFYV
jgi:hypothetical protein